MTVSNRLLNIDPSEVRFLEQADHCLYFGEHVAQGGFNASETNRQIINLKCPVNASAQRLHYKRQAIHYWASKLAEALKMDVVADTVTFVPIPPSKLPDHPEYDDRIRKVLAELSRITGRALDVRDLVRQTIDRLPQHHGARLTPAQLIEIYAVNPAECVTPCRPHIILVHDVITRGASFVAARHLILRDVHANAIAAGIFLAKTVHAPEA